MRQYILTERAHLMCPNMHFGIKIKIAARYDKEKVQAALLLLASAHPFLKSCVARDAERNKLYYRWCKELQVPLYEKSNPSQWSRDYSNITRCGWDAFHESLLKILLYPGNEEYEVIFIAHHLLGDGRSILGLACEFADFYLSGKKPAYTEENLISSIDDLPKGSRLSTISKLLIGSANRKWKNEKHIVSYEDYRRFERKFIANNPVSYIDEAWDAAKTEEILNKCHSYSISLNDYLVAEMMFKEKVSRVVIAVDIRKHLTHYSLGALGNYASATAIELSHQSEDAWSVAKLVAEKVKKSISDPKKLMMILSCYLHMTPELIDAAAISALGDFESKAGTFVGSLILGYKSRNGHSVTNLGNVNNPNITEAMFIPPASPANAQTVGVLSVNHRLRKCTAYYQ